MIEPQLEPPFMLDIAVGADTMFIVIVCNRCLWEGEVEAPTPARTISFRMEEHEKRCVPG